MKAREYMTGDGTPIYTSDKVEAVYCPYTEKLVDFIETCLSCKNHYQEDRHLVHCLRPTNPKEKEE
jgi:hypothetical protein